MWLAGRPAPVGLFEFDIKKLRQCGPQYLVAALETVFGCVVVQGVEYRLFVRSEEQGEFGHAATRDGVGDRLASLGGNLVAVAGDLFPDGFGLRPQLDDDATRREK